jgi:1-acyl-sn-glycerol-3-phosphate acyltransferase
MIKQFRLTFRILAVSLISSGFYLLWLIGLVFVFTFAEVSHSWRNWIFRHWSKVIVTTLNIKLTVEGVPPKAPFFLVSNHLSYVDIIVLASQLDCVFVAKSDVRDWPVVGFLCRSMDMIFINRERRADIPRVIGLIEQAWKKKQGVIVFPEGTSSKGSELLPFKASLLEPAVKARFPVSYASLTYQTPADETPAYLSVCWWGDMTFAPHAIDLFRLSEFQAKVVFGAQTFLEDDRKVLAQKLRTAIEQQFTPVIRPEEECKAVVVQ